MVHVFDVALFRAQFPAFADETKYPDELLLGYFSMATCFINPIDWPKLHCDCMQLALNQATAHLTQLGTMIARKKGNAPAGVVSASTIDKVSVTLQAPPVTSGFEQWLSLTPYGQMLWALLSIKGVGGWYFGGSGERRAFRKAGGRF